MTRKEGLQNQSGSRKIPGGFDSLPSPPSTCASRLVLATIVGNFFIGIECREICLTIELRESLRPAHLMMKILDLTV